MNTKVNYLYRDGCNYKVHNEIIVRGKITNEQINRIYNKCDGEFFIPEQIGLPVTRFEDITEDDHCYCEFSMLKDLDFIFTNDEPTEDMTVDELVKKFENVKFWDDVTYAVM